MENDISSGIFTNETLLSTPTPRASSTVQRPLPGRSRTSTVPHSFALNNSGTSAESLGLLDFHSLQPYSLDYLEPDKSTDRLNHSSRQSCTNRMLQKQRDLASSLLERSQIGCNLPSRFLKPDTLVQTLRNDFSESTVNESDLMQSGFKPADISTPRSSTASNEGESGSTSQNVIRLSSQFKNTDMSITELFEQFKQMESQTFNESFTSGELALQKLMQHEQSWRKDREPLGGIIQNRETSFFQTDISNSRYSQNVTDFFKKKSELGDLFLKDSPEKEDRPVPLIEVSGTSERRNVTCEKQDVNRATKADDSFLSLSEIERVLLSNDDTIGLMEYIKRKGKDRKSNKSPSSKTTKSTQDTLRTDIPERDYDDFKENQGGVSPRSITSQSERKSSLQNRSSSLNPLKESSNNLVYKSSLSLRTASSLDSLPGGKLPLESNRIELVWGCVPVGKKKTHTFLLRNKSQNKLRLQLQSSSPCFKIINDRSEADAMQVLPILLYPAESRLFSVSFTPSTTGAVVEKINFRPLNIELQQQQTKRQQLYLYGYGGYTNIDVQDVTKDTNMKMWLAMGKLSEACDLTQKFTLYNQGTLPGFASLRFVSKALYGYSKIVIHPTEVVLQPKQSAVVSVSYTPTKDDVRHIFAIASAQVVDIGMVQVIVGEEALRGRIRRLCRKIHQEGGIIGSALVERLSSKFLNESIPQDVNKITETVAAMKELMLNLISKEIVLTLETDPDRPFSEQLAGIDDSSTFHSLAEGMTTMIHCPPNTCVVEPTMIVLTPPNKSEDNIIFTNNGGKRLQFQTSFSGSDALHVEPAEGLVLPHETILLKVFCNHQKLLRLEKKEEKSKLAIFVDDNVYEVDVKVILLGIRK